MQILIRVDTSVSIGTGHMVRCINLAIMLRKTGHNVTFICRDAPGSQHSLATMNGFELLSLPVEALSPDAKVGKRYSAEQEEDANACRDLIGARYFDWVIVDHYHLDAEWERRMRSISAHIMVIDDLANRPHDCDLLLDQNFYYNCNERYTQLVDSDCRMLLGPQYLLLDEQFEKYRDQRKIRTGPVGNILVFFGGVDIARQTELVLEAIVEIDHPKLVWNVVVGAQNPRRSSIKKICERREDVNFQCQVTNMSDFIYSADFALGAGGMSGWERCWLGLPSITAIVADNQIEPTINAERAGAIINLGASQDLNVHSYYEAISKLLKQPDDQLPKMSENCYNITRTEGRAGILTTLDELSGANR